MYLNEHFYGNEVCYNLFFLYNNFCHFGIYAELEDSFKSQRA